MVGNCIVKTLYVNLGERKYPIFVGSGIMVHAGKLLADNLGFDTPPIVVSNQTVLRLHGAKLLRSLERSFGRVSVVRIGDGERFKNHSTLLKIYQAMFRAHANRGSWVLAFGGGVVGDIAGFAAATFMRGLAFVMVPTTLLAQVDSAIGGKVGINVREGKNLIGAFHQPAAVLSDTDALKTLPGRELASGLYEVIKCGAIRSEALLCYLEEKLPAILRCGAREMEHIVYEAARIKSEVVEQDEREKGLRMILNYGHTIGHALEAATNYKKFKHGEAVAWGMIASLEFGQEMGRLKADSAARLKKLIREVGPLPSLRRISWTDLWRTLVRDKKFADDNMRMILLRRLGEAEVCSGIDPARLRRFLRRFLAANS